MVNDRRLAAVLMPLSTSVSSQCLFGVCASDQLVIDRKQNKINLEPDICTTVSLLHKYVQRGQ